MRTTRIIRTAIGACVSHGILIVAVVLTLAPIAWMVGISFKGSDSSQGPLDPLPREPTFENYRQVFAASDVLREFLNSLVFAGGVTLGLLLVSIPAAYSLARWKVRGSSLFMAAVLIGLSVPFIVTYLPNFLFITRVGALNTFAGLILPQVANGYGILLLTQSFRSIPSSLFEAAELDGANTGQTLTRVVLPTMWAPVFAIALFIFISTWNELVWPLLVAPAEEMHVLPVGLTQFAALETGVNYGPLMAAAMLTAAPTLFLYVMFRRRVLSVVLEGGGK